ncbi:hypothetical protein BBAD15_g11578 [Beauveria bassiana D1-5]|uniref:Protein kinase domain-containing protein n=1 Tax=Beauveria bassiana D1-5 TaxID=1245745 RepID=A0A0A2VAV1_BEABA|nr:hypothetical protein BBAD15_g11578 [Beauveria bassiana D1-5]
MSSSPTASALSLPPSSPLSSVSPDDDSEDELANVPHSSDDDSKDELVGVQPSEVKFLETLSTKRSEKNGNNLVITFKVEIRGKTCVMKVFKDGEYLPDYFEIEASAYRLLKEKGFCKRGLVPNFYGIIEYINVDLWPDLYDFKHHKWPPSAILIEYIPNAKMISLDNFSQDNIDRLSAYLAEFHEAGLCHGDPYPRNMMVVQGTPEDRVFWLDFDNSSRVEDRKTCNKRQEWAFQAETRAMAAFAKVLAMDAKSGKLEEAWYHYH